MAFGIGIVAAFVAFRRRKGSTRLKLLKQGLEERAGCGYRVKLYQYPAKLIFALIFLLAMGACFQWFAHQFKIEIQTHLDTLVSLNPYAPINIIQVCHQGLGQEKSPDLSLVDTYQQQLKDLRVILNIFHVVFAIGIVALLFNLKLKIVETVREEKIILLTTCKLLPWGQKEETIYRVKEGDRLEIWQMGYSKVTNTNYYFSVRVVGGDGSRNIIKRSCIYDARTAVIKLANSLVLPFSTKINQSRAQSNGDQDKQ